MSNEDQSNLDDTSSGSGRQRKATSGASEENMFHRRQVARPDSSSGIIASQPSAFGADAKFRGSLMATGQSFAIQPLHSTAASFAWPPPPPPEPGISSGATADHGTLYGGNIAAACEAANKEAARKRKDISKDDGDEESNKKRAASRIIAWQSRERKRIEKEVLQERQAELLQRNTDLKNENGQLRQIIGRLKHIVGHLREQTPSFPNRFPMSTPPASSSSGSTVAAATLQAMTESMHTPLHTNSSGSLHARNPFGLTAMHTASMSGPPSRAQPSLQRGYTNTPYQRELPILQPQLQLQLQQSLGQARNYPSAFAFPTQNLPVRTLLSLQQAMLQPAHRQPVQEQQQHSQGVVGSVPFDISSLLLPPGDMHVNVPLVRAFPKRKKSENSEESKKKPPK